jgi:hypothetical protein
MLNNWETPMATINITVQSLLNTAVYDLQIVDTAGTIGDLKTAMVTNFSYSADWFDLVFNESVLDTAQTIGSYGIVEGSRVRTHNKIARLSTREDRQKAKLDLAALDRAASGNPRATYDITQLPTQYVGNTVVDNPNLAELTLNSSPGGAGVKKVTYAGYHNDDVAFTDTATVTDTTISTNFTIATVAVENITVLYTGYLLADYTGTWTFEITSDDASYVWIGSTAITGYTTGNKLATASYLGPGTGTISLTAGEYYPIRLLYGNGPASGSLNLTYAHTGQTATNNFTGKLFTPGVQLVVGRPWTT